MGVGTYWWNGGEFCDTIILLILQGREDMTEMEQKKAAKAFAEKWQGRGYEKGETQLFWVELLQTVYGVENPASYMECEVQVQLENTSFIDIYLPATKVMIEQKSINKDLSKAIRQSDGTMLTPLQQLKRYAAALGYFKYPRWGITCNFREFYIYDMGQPNGEPAVLKLEDLPTEYHRLNFLVDAGDDRIKQELEISLNAGALVGRMYEMLLKQYGENPTEEMLKSLNMLIVRIVFCLYAEDAGIFGRRNMFHDYLADFQPKHFRRALIDLFEVLDTPDNARDPYMEKILAEFPYVNGGLFADNHLIIPTFSEECVDLILNVACPFSWEGISPTIFGAVFESTLSAKIRRSGGMHYTSLENIHKVIDPLFLNDLQKEYEAIADIPQPKVQKQKLEAFQDKLAGLKFCDPACGSGNFLTETYISLRRLENKVIDRLTKGQIVLGEMASPVKVNIHQFYGIEINDFACVVAKTAMWIAELQMMQETQSIVEMNLDFLPLKSYVNIVEGNALRMDWQEVLPPSQCNYIMGNPPFVGYSLQSKEQKADMLDIYVDEKGKSYKTAGKIDYVAGWYFKAAEYMQNTGVRTAFVSTNSITQGEQVAAVWKPLYDRFGIHIDFAWRTFIWNSESNEKAHVHCVIIGFSVDGYMQNKNDKSIYLSENNIQFTNNINPFLLDGPNVFIESRKKSLCGVPVIVKGSSPVDGQNLLLSEDEYLELIKKEPDSKKFVFKFLGAKEFLHGIHRYCLWLVGANPSEIQKLPLIKERIKKVRDFRLNSTKAATRKFAETPMVFMENRQPATNYILLPRHTSQNRKYIPMDFLPPNVICGDANIAMPTATLYHFGVLESNVHMAWMRAICGRIKSDYRYSNDIVYNNFPWPTPTDAQKAKIEKTAQGILDARAKYPDSSLADLYDEVLMPPELRKAHQANDRAVMEVYGFWGKLNTESECVAQLMKMYQKLVDNIEKKK